MPIKNILITGLPHSGKSTILEQILPTLSKPFGFITRERRINDERVGFDIIDHLGQVSILADVTSQSPIRVSHYGVEVENLEMIIPNFFNFSPDNYLYLDEIGQMEFYAPSFGKLVEKFLDSPNPVIATVSKIYRNETIERMLKRPDTKVFEITPENRDSIKELIVYAVKQNSTSTK